MKVKKRVYLLCVFLFFAVLTACDTPVSSADPSGSGVGTGESSEITDPSGSDIGTSESSEITDPTDNTEKEPAITAEDCFLFVYSENQTFTKDLNIDRSALKNNCLYIHNKNSGENQLVAELNIKCFGASDNYIYCIL